MSDLSDEDTSDLLESVAEMRANNGWLEVLHPLCSEAQARINRELELFVADLREFGFSVDVRRDSTGMVCGVRFREN